MSKYLKGRAGDREALRRQLEAIHDSSPGTVFVGSLGRTAIYSSFGYAAPPWPIRKPNGDHSDLDVLFAPPYLANSSARTSPHELDFSLRAYLDNYSDGLFLTGHNSINGFFEIHLDPLTQETRVRDLDGMPVTTFTVGLQQRAERLVNPTTLTPDSQAKYDKARRKFDLFAREIRLDHPDEFPPQQVLAPFVEFSARNTS